MSPTNLIDTEILSAMRTNTQQNLLALSDQQPVMLVFLRHFGCNFCREGLAHIARNRKEIESQGIDIVFVHMSDNKTAEKYFTKYQLSGVPHISDAECTFYRAFGLFHGTVNQLFGLSTWFTGAKTVLKHGVEYGKLLGDSFQMPGVFMVYKREIADSFVHAHVAEQPDYFKLAKCCV
jgi:peroxiredoxin